MTRSVLTIQVERGVSADVRKHGDGRGLERSVLSRQDAAGVGLDPEGPARCPLLPEHKPDVQGTLRFCLLARNLPQVGKMKHNLTRRWVRTL